MPVTTQNLLARMQDLSLQDVDKTFLGMIYGNNGVGKTSTAAWLAQRLRGEGRVAYIDSAEGWVSLEENPYLIENVSRLPYTSYDDLPALADAIEKKVRGFGDITVVIVDELDSISDDVLTTVVRERHGTPKSQRLPEIEGKDYRPMGDLMKLAISKFQKAGVHLILVAHDKQKTDHRKVTTTAPALSPQYRNSISGLMHVVAYASAEIKGTASAPEYVRTLQALPTSLVDAKTRIGALKKTVKVTPDYFVDAVASWVGSEQMAEDLAADEEQVEIEPDEMPADGIPVADVTEGDDDDEPAYVGSDEN